MVQNLDPNRVQTPAPRTRFSGVRAWGRLLLMAMGLGLILLPLLLLWALRADHVRRKCVQGFHRYACWLLNIKVSVEGDLYQGRPMLMVANHASYIDVFVLGSIAPMSFTPKKEIEKWPVIGFLCKLSDCVFVERRPSEIKTAQVQIQQKLANGKIVTVFPEGTTNDGNAVKHFKSSMFYLAEQGVCDPPLPVQPATVAYTHMNGELLDREGARDAIAWHGDADFAPHFMQLLGLRSIKAKIVLHPVRDITAYDSRKALCAACEEEVQVSLQTVFTALETERVVHAGDTLAS